KVEDHIHPDRQGVRDGLVAGGIDEILEARPHDQAGVDVNWGAQATLTLWLAPLPLLTHVAVFVFFPNPPEYPLMAFGVCLVTVALILYPVSFGKHPSLRVIPPSQRRQLRSSWLGNFIGLILVVLTILRMMHPTTPEEWFVIYALWLILAGCTFFSLAANVGILYVSGSLCFLLAVLAPFVAFYMPLIAGSLLSVNMTTYGLLLRRLAREATAHSTAPPGGPPLTQATPSRNAPPTA